MKIEAEKQQEVLEENKREVEALKRSLQNVTRDQVQPLITELKTREIIIQKL